MNVFFEEKLHISPDIWGSMVGMGLMLMALLAVPFLDRGEQEPANLAEAFNRRKRGLAFLAIAVFWIIMIVGIVQNAVAGAG